MNKKKICILVPVWKPYLNFHEQHAIQQLYKVLSPDKYDIFLIGPEYLNETWYKENLKYVSLVRFWDSYFATNISYSKLMLNSGFYNSFRDYEFMLIYQTDAWVFKDDLMEWVAKGYDYIGAPFMFRYPSSHGGAVKKRMYNGNGGVSLRNIEVMIEQLGRWGGKINLDGIYEDILISEQFNFNKVPTFMECVNFSWDTEPDLLWQVNQFHLPTFCHNYLVNGYDFYKDFGLIEYYKYLDDLYKQKQIKE
jgi:hypothetical protein